MKTSPSILLAIVALVIVRQASAQVPQQLNYQGRVVVQGVNFNGSGQFKFALVDGGVSLNQRATAVTTASGSIIFIVVQNPGSGYLEPPVVTIGAPQTPGGTQATAIAVLGQGGGTGTGPTDSVYEIQITEPGSGYTAPPLVTIAPPPANIVTSSFWSNDGTSTVGDEPQTAVALPVTNGLYSVPLASAALGMSAFDTDIFASPLFLRVWFDDGVHGFQQLTPDQPLGAAPYAMRAKLAETVPPGAIGPVQLANNAVSAAKLADGAVSAAKLAPASITSSVFDTGGDAPAAGKVLGFTNDGLRWVNGGGLTLPFSGSGSSATAAFSASNSSSGAGILGTGLGGDGVSGLTYQVGASGVFGRTNTVSNGQGVFGYSFLTGVGVLGVSEGNDGISGRTNAEGKSGVFGYTEKATSWGGFFNNNAGGFALGTAGKAEIGGWLYVRDTDFWIGHASRRGSPGRAVVDWRDPGNNTSQLYLNFGDDWAETKIGGAVTEVKRLRITGGADLAEPFALKGGATISKGSIVVIARDGSGTLELSEEPYDTRVAGIVSGANGVHPGVTLHQEGINDHGHNVALSGRVYCRADTSNGAIRPGDLLTTSATPGHAMKATDHSRTQGAVLGKAMSALDEGTGFVLVLVTLQ